MTISTLNLDVFNLILNTLTLSDCCSMSCVCTEWDRFMENEAIWKILAMRVLRVFPDGFNTWRTWFKSVDFVGEFPSRLNFSKGEIHILSGGPSTLGWLFKYALLGAVIVKEICEDKSEDIRFRCSIEGKIFHVIRLGNGAKATGVKSDWAALESLEKDPSVKKWVLGTFKMLGIVLTTPTLKYSSSRITFRSPSS